MIPPGSTIGILGGGQLGRMTAQAAASLGYRTVVLTPETDSPASQVTSQTIVAGYEDRAALQQLADLCDVVTYEFENIPLDGVTWLADHVPVHPSPRVLKICQDRLREKDFVSRLGIATTRYRAVTSFAALADTVGDIGRPVVLKSTRMGYDGKGQATIRDETDLGVAWRQMGAAIDIVERFVDFAYEASVIVARNADGTAHFPTLDMKYALLLDQPNSQADIIAFGPGAHRMGFRRGSDSLALYGVGADNLPDLNHKLAVLRRAHRTAIVASN